MSRYAITIVARGVHPVETRLLVPEPRRVPTLAAAREWPDRMRFTWCDALMPAEDGFSAFVLDEDGSEALALEYGRDPDVPPVEHGRRSLREMKAARPLTTPMTEGETI